MKRFLPLYRHLLKVKWPFLIGVASGLVYAVASGLGLPLMTQVVFPILFDEDPKPAEDFALDLPAWVDRILPLESGLNRVLAAAHDWVSSLSTDQFLLITCLWIPLIFLVRALAGYFNSYLIQYSGLRVLEEIRTDMFAKLQTLPLGFFKRNRSGDLLARLMGDTEILRQVIVNASSDLIKQPATLISALVFLGVQASKDHSFFIALISMVTVPICVILIRSAGKRLGPRAKSLQREGGDLSAVLAESLQSSLEIRAYNLEERQITQFRQRIRKMLGLAMKVAKYRLVISPSIEVVAALGFAAALFFGVRAGMSLEGFMAMGMALYMSYEPIKKLGGIHAQFAQGEAALERMEFIMNEPDGQAEPETPVELGKPAQAIRFEGLSFAYGEESVLKGVDVEIPVGQVVALIGPSGAGKTTFANLVPRFYDPQEGRITIDGIDLRDVAKKALRHHIAVVPQMPSLFAGTVRDNIGLGKLDATGEQIETAAKRAHADGFIRSLPKGYETEVGERGDQLSGGQRQRIAIARAFLRDAPILILDEATSALDAESEAAVQEALADLVKGRTTFIIAHRFSTISVADRILVFQRGEIVADGTHEDLRDSNPIYQAMSSGHVI
ncbi:MAG: ABC transporter ATP-binding protein [Akkermansiaceae bacterium]|nr:ABC transporter ATP-binding protein [Akkermansiaceae bacterium]